MSSIFEHREYFTEHENLLLDKIKGLIDRRHTSGEFFTKILKEIQLLPREEKYTTIFDLNNCAAATATRVECTAFEIEDLFLKIKYILGYDDDCKIEDIIH